MILVNAYFSANGLKKKAKTLHRVLASAVKAERVMAIESMHLSPEYINEHGRDKVCKSSGRPVNLSLSARLRKS